MSNTKRCVQCGILKTEDNFRQYTYSRRAATKGRYRICKDCEALNARYRRAMQRGDTEEFEQIHLLYKALAALGYRTPLTAKPRERTPTATDTLVDQIMSHHGVEVESIVKKDPSPSQPVNEVVTYLSTNGEENLIPVASQAPTELPTELRHWLEVDIQEWIDADISPEYLQETIYESLKAKYRPQTGVDRDLFIPIYDDTYKDVLNHILRRFDDYEEYYITQGESDTDDGEAADREHTNDE